jgi:hypothetical protein
MHPFDVSVKQPDRSRAGVGPDKPAARFNSARYRVPGALTAGGTAAAKRLLKPSIESSCFANIEDQENVPQELASRTGGVFDPDNCSEFNHATT